MKKVTLAGLAIALMTSTSALAQEVKFDETIAKAAAAKAGEKLGALRKRIDYDQTPEMVTKEDLKKKPVNTSYLPQPEETNDNSLPPMTSLKFGIDLTTTGSIRYPKAKITWEKFDRYGNPIK